MNKARNEYLYELVGIIKEKRRKKFKDREGFKLRVELTSHPNTPFIQVFKDKLKDRQIWQQLENSQFIDKRYIFNCQNYFGNYHLISWKEIVSSSRKNKELTNHGSH